MQTPQRDGGGKNKLTNKQGTPTHNITKLTCLTCTIQVEKSLVLSLAAWYAAPHDKGI